MLVFSWEMDVGLLTYTSSFKYAQRRLSEAFKFGERAYQLKSELPEIMGSSKMSHNKAVVSLANRNENITGELYCLRSAIRRNCPGLLFRGILLHHGNVRSYLVHLAQAKVAELVWELHEHPAYSPDLATSDYHLFGPLTNYLSGKHFDDDNDVQQEVREYETVCLQHKKLCLRWIPKMLTELHKSNRIATALAFPEKYCVKEDKLLTEVVIGDETWVAQVIRESKQQFTDFRDSTFLMKLM
ncbi:hypothetical protein Trydic_g10462 [Trypoxylus dichotomus]